MQASEGLGAATPICMSDVQVIVSTAGVVRRHLARKSAVLKRKITALFFAFFLAK
jgi:hypothetical protein